MNEYDELKPEDFKPPTRMQEQQIRIIIRDSRTAADLFDPPGVDRYCDYCKQYLYADAFRTPYDQTCASCQGIKETLHLQRKEDLRKLHQKLTRGKTKHHVLVDGVELKHCSSCSQFLPVAEFYKSSKSGDGLDNKCKACALLSVQLSRLRKRAKELGINVDF
jgi:hypothetical protein